jgi:hypothetical protein
MDTIDWEKRLRQALTNGWLWAAHLLTWSNAPLYDCIATLKAPAACRDRQ